LKNGENLILNPAALPTTLIFSSSQARNSPFHLITSQTHAARLVTSLLEGRYWTNLLQILIIIVDGNVTTLSHIFVRTKPWKYLQIKASTTVCWSLPCRLNPLTFTGSPLSILPSCIKRLKMFLSIGQLIFWTLHPC
jgi:hypothetical protein